MKRLLAIILLCALYFTTQAEKLSEAIFSQPKPHPRLIVNQNSLDSLAEAVKTNPQMARLNDYIIRSANKMLTQPVSVYQKQGKRLLTVSRQVLERVLYCSYSYLTTKDVKYAVRAEQEMIAAAEFNNWNPSHFLDVAEMTTALALGYDWLYDLLSADSRQKIADAIVNKGLLGAEKERQMWFYRSRNNWNQVCNCGMVLGALAVSEIKPELAKQMVEKSLLSNPLSMTTYAPDGVYVEGGGYWSYGTWFEVVMIEALRSALGSSFGIEKAEGFMQSADFINFITAPSGGRFNYSDDGSRLRKSQNPLLGWFAAESGNTSIIYDDFRSLESGKIHIEERRMLPLAMFFLSRCNLKNIEPPTTKLFVGRGEQPLFAYRSGWQSKEDTYLAAKGGSASLPHGHMDAGSFIYEWGGVRWSIDLGSQNYYSLESKGVDLWNMKENSERWDVFRIGSSSHSTLTIGGKNHCVNGCATMTKVYNTPNRYGATFNLTQLFTELSSAERTITINPSGAVSTVDEMRSKRPTSVRWTMTTNAEVERLNDRKFILKQQGKSLLVRASKGAKGFVLTNDPPHSYDAANNNSRRLCFEQKVYKKSKLRVKLIPRNGQQ